MKLFLIFGIVLIASGAKAQLQQDCADGYFSCGSGECIPAEYICEGFNDCEDGSDEADPVSGRCPDCPSSHFQCANNRCIFKESTCNGLNDCEDWADETEELCPCASSEFRCGKLPSEPPMKPGMCIPADQVCDEDGIWDCPEGSDEKNCTRQH